MYPVPYAYTRVVSVGVGSVVFVCYIFVTYDLRVPYAMCLHSHSSSSSPVITAVTTNQGGRRPRTDRHRPTSHYTLARFLEMT